MKNLAIKTFLLLVLFSVCILHAGVREDASRIMPLLSEGNAIAADSLVSLAVQAEPGNPFLSYLRFSYSL